MAGGAKYEQTGGVKPMNIGGRVAKEKERLHGMTTEERAWRKRWLMDQNLTPNEPKIVPALKKELLNPLRRLYRFPLDYFFIRAVSPVTGPAWAGVFRFYTGRIFLGVWGAFAMIYYFKYNTNTWEGKGRWRITESKKAVYPGEPGYPYVAPVREPHQFHDRKFGESIFAPKFPQYQTQEK